MTDTARPIPTSVEGAPPLDPTPANRKAAPEESLRVMRKLTGRGDVLDGTRVVADVDYALRDLEERGAIHAPPTVDVTGSPAYRRNVYGLVTCPDPGAPASVASTARPPRPGLAPVPTAVCPPHAAWRPARALGLDPVPASRPAPAQRGPGPARLRLARPWCPCVARARLGPGVCATRSRHVSAALRVRARVVHGALAWLVVPATQRIAPCRARDTIVYPESPVYPPVHSVRSDRMM